MDMEDANKYEIDSLIKTKKIKDDYTCIRGVFCLLDDGYDFSYFIN